MTDNQKELEQSMKVRDLLSQLQGLDRSMELVCFCDDEGARQRRSPFLVYEIQRVDVTSMPRRNDEAFPRVQFGSGAERVAVVQISTDI
jgi:hypothetical protein